MAYAYDAETEAALVLRVKSLEDEQAEVNHELREARQTLKNYREEHAEERARSGVDLPMRRV